MPDKAKLSAQGDRRYYFDLCLLSIPLISMSYFYYGIRPVLMCLYAAVLGNLCDRLVDLLRRRKYDRTDWSNECFGLIIALLMPASCDWMVLTIAVLAGILIGKEAFGGYGNYPFHPAAVGYVVAAVSWPEEVMRYPVPGTQLPIQRVIDPVLSGGISSILKKGGVPNTDLLNMMLGNYAGPIGTTAILVLLACGIYLLVRRDISWETPFAFLATCAVIAFCHPRQAMVENAIVAQTAAGRTTLALYELLSGALLFGALFLATEPFTSPREHRGGKLLYGVLLGILTMAFRYFGEYDTGICFAVLLVGSVAQWLDHLVDWMYDRAAARKQKGGTADAQ